MPDLLYRFRFCSLDFDKKKNMPHLLTAISHAYYITLFFAYACTGFSFPIFLDFILRVHAFLWLGKEYFFFWRQAILAWARIYPFVYLLFWLNPSIKFSWAKDEWQTKYGTVLALSSIQTLSACSICFLFFVIILTSTHAHTSHTIIVIRKGDLKSHDNRLNWYRMYAR